LIERQLSSWRRQFIFARDDMICQLCGERCSLSSVKLEPTVDHIVPRSKGGSDLLDNLQTAHRSCNSRKGTMDNAQAIMQMRSAA
jgi:5-methylcytosine-specific restriction endonuclease McrA